MRVDGRAAICWAGVAGVAAAAAAFDASARLFPVDFSIFGAAADTLLSAGWADSFTDADVQVGPLHLLLLGLLRSAARALDVQHRLLVAVATQIGVALGAMAVLRAVSGRRAPLQETVVGIATVVGGLGWVAYISGHPEEVAIGLLWTWASVRARTGDGLASGAILAAAAALKLAGLLGLPLLLLLPAERRKVALVTCGVSLVCVYAPFFIWGDVATFSYAWSVESAVLSLLLPAVSEFPWWMRALQAAITVALGSCVAIFMATRAGIVWLLPMVLLAIRVLLDPMPHYYLWTPFEVLALIAAIDLGGLARPRRIWLPFAAYGLTLARYLPAAAGVTLRLALLATLSALVHRDPWLDPAPPGSSGSRGEQTVAGTGRAV